MNGNGAERPGPGVVGEQPRALDAGHIREVVVVGERPSRLRLDPSFAGRVAAERDAAALEEVRAQLSGIGKGRLPRIGQTPQPERFSLSFSTLGTLGADGGTE